MYLRKYKKAAGEKMTDKLVTIAAYSDSLQAELSKTKLESKGITCFVKEDVARSLFGYAAGKIKLQTKQSDAKRALEILQIRADEKKDKEKPEIIKAKIQMTIGLFTAAVIGIGIIVTAGKWRASHFYGVALLGVPALIVFLGTYILALIIKEYMLGRLILLIWSVGWAASWVFMFFFGPSGPYGTLCTIFSRWPGVVLGRLFGVSFPEALDAFCFVLVAVLLWIGTCGVSQLVKAEIEAEKKSLSE